MFSYPHTYNSVPWQVSPSGPLSGYCLYVLVWWWVPLHAPPHPAKLSGHASLAGTYWRIHDFNEGLLLLCLFLENLYRVCHLFLIVEICTKTLLTTAKKRFYCLNERRGLPIFAKKGDSGSPNRDGSAGSIVVPHCKSNLSVLWKVWVLHRQPQPLIPAAQYRR